MEAKHRSRWFVENGRLGELVLVFYVGTASSMVVMMIIMIMMMMI